MKRIVVVLVSAGVFAALCRDAGLRLADDYPSIGQCIENPAKHAGKHVFISPNLVLSSDEFSFDVDGWDFPVRVYSAIRPPVGSYAMVYGTFQSDLSVMAIKVREEPAYETKRAGVYLVSFLVLAVGAFFFHRTFAWRDGAFHPR